ncbi:MAG: hypothetical protein KAS57_05215 [Gammaproteobacteria bacterium]|nr:hypothetical protein [Gammaproteobacteria bacterium]
MKIFIGFTCALMVFFTQYAIAEEHPFVPHAASALSIKLSNDRTGIIKNVVCTGCKFTNVNITPKTKAYRNGVEVDLLEAKRQAGKPALVSFNPETREVQAIRWNDLVD